MSSTVKLSTGAHMPLMGFGMYRLTGYDNIFKALDVALATGYRLIDHAQMYSNEADIGEPLSILMPKYGLKREDLFITSKLLRSNMSTEKARASIEQSIRDLKTDYIDLFLIHYPKADWLDPQDPRNKDARSESWLELEKLHEEGKLKAIGVSNYETRHLDEMAQYAKIQPAVNQCEFHPHYCRRDLVDEMRRRRIHFQAFTSLGRNSPELMAEPLLRELAEKYKVSVAQILLAWPMSQGIGVIPKSSTPNRIKENFEAVNVRLSQEDSGKIWGLHNGMHYSVCRPEEVL